MTCIQTVATYPEEGFAVLQDDLGKFLMFEDTDKTVELDEPTYQQATSLLLSKYSQGYSQVMA